MHYVYLLVSHDGEIYVGFTSDLKRRIAEHKGGCSKATKHRNWQFAYYEAYANKKDAVKREQKLKQDGRSKRWLLKRAELSFQDLCGLK